ncbi:unnamed protein product [Linum trigynum]|uniref:F-box domain-containing protein n=1 Tax=Linum trigynum TaxID=586398 RepID=A0AAV2GU87_9ROSI
MAATGSGHGTKPCSGSGSGGGDGDGHLPEELAIEILKRLRSRRSVGRSRCVSKSWYRLLSDPNIIRDILFFDNRIESGAQILIIRRRREDHPEFVGRRGSGRASAPSPTIYSQLSYHTLQPTIPAAPFPDLLISPTIAGCSHGIFCIYGKQRH